jgi:hypothetical protein
MKRVLFNNLSHIGILSLGFVGGIAFIISCGGGGGNSATAQAPSPITGVTITKVIATGTPPAIDDAFAIATCPANSFLIGGSCGDSSNSCTRRSFVKGSGPMSSTQWRCETRCIEEIGYGPPPVFQASYVSGGVSVPTAIAFCASTTPPGAISVN